MVFEFKFAAYRDASREGEGEGEKGEKNVYLILIRPRAWLVAGSKKLMCKLLTMWPRIEVAWTTTALQQPIRIHGVYSTSVDGILPHKILYKLFETISVSLRISTYWLLSSWWCPHGTTKTAHLEIGGVTCLSIKKESGVGTCVATRLLCINAGRATFTPRDTQQQCAWFSQKDDSSNLQLLLVVDWLAARVALLLLLPLLLGILLLRVFFALSLVRNNI